MQNNDMFTLQMELTAKLARNFAFTMKLQRSYYIHTAIHKFNKLTSVFHLSVLLLIMIVPVDP